MCSAAFCQLPRRPVDVGAQPQRLAALEAGDHLEREIVAADVGQRARLDHQPRHADLVGEVGGAGRAQHGLRLVRLVVHQIDHGKPRRHLGARGALQAVVDLVLQQLGALVEQIDGDEPLGELADHLVAAPADRGELAEIVEQAERVDRRQRVALAGEEQRVEGLGRLLLDVAGQRRGRIRAQRHAHDVERIAVVIGLGVEPRQRLQRLDLGLVAAPGGGEHFQLADEVRPSWSRRANSAARSRGAAPAPPPAGRSTPRRSDRPPAHPADGRRLRPCVRSAPTPRARPRATGRWS